MSIKFVPCGLPASIVTLQSWLVLRCQSLFAYNSRLSCLVSEKLPVLNRPVIRCQRIVLVARSQTGDTKW